MEILAVLGFFVLCFPAAVGCLLVAEVILIYLMAKDAKEVYDDDTDRSGGEDL